MLHTVTELIHSGEICVIMVKPNSLEEYAVEMRLDRSDRNKLRPFFVAPQQIPLNREPPIFFEYSECSPPVYAEIQVEKGIASVFRRIIHP